MLMLLMIQMLIALNSDANLVDSDAELVDSDAEMVDSDVDYEDIADDN